MSDGFFDASGGGDPVYFQHMMWMMSKPEFWLMIIKWIIIIIGIILIGKKLIKTKQYIWAGLFTLAVIATAALQYYLTKNAFQLFTEGPGHEVIFLRYMNLATNLLALGGFVWIATKFIRRKTH